VERYFPPSIANWRLFEDALVVLFGVDEPLYRDAAAARAVSDKVFFKAADSPDTQAFVLTPTNLAGPTHLGHSGKFGVGRFNG